ncbi:hypothetical protein HYALB_00000663 [Hymenoscyphus albidus]|uniref:Uncharacterized protein n=1 Tax=Hymenoscyphus albidus TaxID=595503 RepID=A0A9N9LT76_9HELO|nr:hypothetical protein HYALB_00000663 [Hymenoscyphus albidus]
MGSGTSRESVIDSEYWEAESQRILRTTTNTYKIEMICSLIPFKDEKALFKVLEARSDLDTLFAHYCGSGEQTVDLSRTNNEKAAEIWRVLRYPPGYGVSWDWNWEMPLTGDPGEIANEFHAAVCRAVFRIPLLDFVLQQRYHPLAYWIIASSLHDTTDAPYDALAATINQTKTCFTKRNLDSVLDRLMALDRRFKHINENYNWDKWSTNLELWKCTSQALWTGTLTIPTMPPDMLSEDQEEILSFLRDLESTLRGQVRKMLSFLKRPGKLWHQRIGCFPRWKDMFCNESEDL